MAVSLALALTLPLTLLLLLGVAAWNARAADLAPHASNRVDAAQHWAFRPVGHPAVPQVGNPSWVRNPIDAFLAAGHEKHGLIPLEAAPPQVLLRRLYLDLIGVPPTASELREFTSDPSEAAYARVVDRLLASPHYGERWGRHWMDIWRYSDWAGHGAEVRESQPYIWRWRDWIIESLNADKPYDRMILEMLAADEIAPLDPDSLRATGFMVRNWFRYNRNVWLEDTVEHTGKAFLGLTLNCAKCHDHKFDPIEQTDFYRFRAFFEPYDIRTNSLSLQGDANANSLVRVFDARPDATTYVFTRGNEARPETNNPMAPRLPRFFTATSPAVTAVDLPVESYYPSLGEGAVADALARADTEVKAAERKASAARTAAERSTNTVATEMQSAQGAARIATLKLAVAQSQRASLRQRIKAERLKYGLATGEPYAAARAAAAAERQVAVAAAEQGLAEAEGQVQPLREPKEPRDAKAQQALADTEKKVVAAKETLSRTTSASARRTFMRQR